MQAESATVVEFDFQTRRHRTIPWSEVQGALNNGFCLWIDIDRSRVDSVGPLLAQLGLHDVAVEEAAMHEVDGRHDVYDECLHASVTAAEAKNGNLDAQHVDLILTERAMITIHRGPTPFLDQVRRSFPPFFVKYAQSLGFLLFEFWDKLIDVYRRSLQRVENEVGHIQSLIFGEVDDLIFNQVGEVTHQLLLLRKHVLAAREVLEQLATRKSGFVSETTQPYLENMVGTLERLGHDLTIEREIMGETVNLYLGMVSHRTNRMVNRLTLISVIFLPLTFLVGVYGMNFKLIPELHWTYGYLYFWIVTVLLFLGLLWWSRWKKWF
jgi:magnesium transporter